MCFLKNTSNNENFEQLFDFKNIFGNSSPKVLSKTFESVEYFGNK